MRLKTLIPFICFIAILVAFVACKKEPFNYRNKYIGDWKFTVNRREFNIDSIGHSESETIVYDGIIKYGEHGNQLVIEYYPNQSITVAIDKEGALSEFPRYCSGEFGGSNVLKLSLYYGGLGGGISYSVYATKK